ncbi:hypothetical protein GUJ93_ZPchr0465g6486 [Zizania palustris]|nr:hypothetical protein GUJ93_ZPchr0465g6486 [Zizania palustris]
MWGYSLFIFIPASVLLLIPVEFLRWVIIVLAGGASSCLLWHYSSKFSFSPEIVFLVFAQVSSTSCPLPPFFRSGEHNF